MNENKRVFNYLTRVIFCKDSLNVLLYTYDLTMEKVFKISRKACIVYGRSDFELPIYVKIYS
jgi:hypothetical protein